MLLSELPVHLQPSCRVGSFASDGMLTIYSTSGAVASKLRLQAPSLLAKLKKLRAEVTAIRIEVQVSPLRPEPGPKRARIAGTGVTEFKALAGRLEEGPLKQALLKLVRHGETGQEIASNRPVSATANGLLNDSRDARLDDPELVAGKPSAGPLKSSKL